MATVDLGEVLFPLRYDVWDQAPDVKSLACLRGDVLHMIEAGRDTAVYRHVAIADPVYQAIGLLPPATGSDLDRRIERYYGAHIEKLTTYYLSIQEGWDDTKDRIYFKRVQDPTVTTTGHPVPPGLFLNNGQHRTTVLLALGYIKLPDRIAAVMNVSGIKYKPLDMTEAYIRAGTCTEQRFVDFARFRFRDIPEEVVDASGLATWAEEQDIAWLADYVSIYWGNS